MAESRLTRRVWSMVCAPSSKGKAQRAGRNAHVGRSRDENMSERTDRRPERAIVHSLGRRAAGELHRGLRWSRDDDSDEGAVDGTRALFWRRTSREEKVDQVEDVVDVDLVVV